MPEAWRTRSSAQRVWKRGWEGGWSLRVSSEGESLMWHAARMRWVRDMEGWVRRGRMEMGSPEGVWWVW